MAKPKKIQEHMDKVAQLGCIIDYCNDPFVELHHVQTLAKGKKNNDWQVIPLCLPHHRTGGAEIAVHASGYDIWVENHGNELGLLIQTLEEIGLVDDK